MEDQLGEPASLTQEGLDEKVQQANQRRNQVITQNMFTTTKLALKL